MQLPLRQKGTILICEFNKDLELIFINVVPVRPCGPSSPGSPLPGSPATPLGPFRPVGKNPESFCHRAETNNVLKSNQEKLLFVY